MTTYSRPNLLSLKLRSATHLRKLSRAEMLARLQIVRSLEPLVEQAFRISEEMKFEKRHTEAPHGSRWHVSFHASQFPGDDPQACPRQSLYRMMDLPGAPFSRRSRVLMNAGKQAELDIVDAFAEAGMLLSAKPTDKIQTGFEVPESWLTGSVDCVILRHNRPLPIEIKTKDRETIDDMRMGKVGPDIAHVFQLKTQLGLVALAQDNGEKWANLDRVTHGFIYYQSRGDKKGEREIITAEFRVDLDERFFEIGIERLKQWQQMFLDDVLPEDNPGKRTSKFGHPMGWKWSYLPCAWCDFKKTCQLDFRQDIHQLSESVGIDRAKLVRKDYDLEAARQRVKDRWTDKEQK